MSGGTLLASRVAELHPLFKKHLEQTGFSDVAVTGAEKDGLNRVINELKPRLLLMEAGFYHYGTPLMAGELRRKFPRLHIAAVSVFGYPLSKAVWFVWHGVQSYINLWEGYDEFQRGLRMLREGRQYISPMVQYLIENSGEWPDTNNRMTKRLKECLVMLCCGLIPEHIGEMLHISRRTVNGHLERLYRVFHVQSREEMVALAWQLQLVTVEDILFYERKTDYAKIPDWAEAKLRIDKQLLAIRG